MDTIFSSRLKALRKESGMSQDAVCRKIGEKQGTYSTWEIGKYEPPLGVLIKLAQLFNVSADYLLGIQESRQLQGSNLGKLEGLKAAIRTLLEQY